MRLRSPFGLALTCISLVTAIPLHAAETGCVRSAPSPMFHVGANVQAHRFAAATSREATETFALQSGVRVTVEHGGCEYFVTTFRFDGAALPALAHDSAHRRADAPALAYRAAAAFLRELDRLHADTGFLLPQAAATLERAAVRTPRFDTELAVEGDGIAPLQAVVKLDGAGRRGHAGEIVVTLLRGPL